MLTSLAIPSWTAPARADDEAMYNAGIRRMQVSDPATGESFRATLFYPTLTPASTVELGIFTEEWAPHATVADGRFPLIVLSHGDGGSDLGHRDTALHLARHGYLVAAPLHPRNNYEDNSGEGDLAVLSGRPRQVTRTIDAVLAHRDFGAAVDGARIAVAGFSAGGYTALAAAGGRPSLTAVRDHCAENAARDPGFCRLVPPPDDPYYDGAIVVEPDRRLRAAVVMAPAGVYFAPGSLDDVRIPIRLYRAEHDRVLGHPYHADAVRRRLPRPPEYVVIEGAGHLAFLAPFPEAVREEFADLAVDPPGFDRAAMHARLNDEILDFFERTLTP